MDKQGKAKSPTRIDIFRVQAWGPERKLMEIELRPVSGKSEIKEKYSTRKCHQGQS